MVHFLYQHFNTNVGIQDIFRALKCNSTFFIVAQWSAPEKLQGERGLQTVYTGRYLWTFGLVVDSGFTIKLKLLIDVHFVCV